MSSCASYVSHIHDIIDDVTILRILKYETHLQFDFIYEKIAPNYAINSTFHDDDVTDDVTEWPKNRPSIFLYI